MSQQQQHSESGHHGGGHQKPAGKKLHKDWRVWAGVILMLGCMVIYLLTMDESIVPTAPPAPNAAATNAAPAPR